MSVTTGTQGVDATPTSTFYTNVLSGALTTAGWTAIHTLTSANAGTTGNVEVWKCTATGTGNFYVFIEKDDTNGNLRIRASEVYNENSSTPRIQKPVSLGGATNGTLSNTSVTPTANSTVTDSDTTLTSTNPWISNPAISMPSGGFSYIYEVRDNLMTIATRVSGTNYYVVVGKFTSLVTGLTDDHPICMFSHSFNQKLGSTASIATTAHGDGCVSRTPGRTAAESGAFAVTIRPLHAANLAAAASLAFVNDARAYNNITPRYQANGNLSPAIIHQCASGGVRSTFRGYLPDFKAGILNLATDESLVGDTVTIDGVVYYWLGVCNPGGARGAITANETVLLAIKG